MPLSSESPSPSPPPPPAATASPSAATRPRNPSFTLPPLPRVPPRLPQHQLSLPPIAAMNPNPNSNSNNTPSPHSSHFPSSYQSSNGRQPSQSSSYSYSTSQQQSASQSHYNYPQHHQQPYGYSYQQGHSSFANPQTTAPHTLPPPVVATTSVTPSPTGGAAHSTSSPSASSLSKRKRKSTDASRKSTDDDRDSGAESVRNGTTAEQLAAHKKRTKTQRACDSCRSRKIRCDILPDSEPPLCQHCKQYTFDCTFFLPITETRFKKKRGDEQQAPSPSVGGVTPKMQRSASSKEERDKDLLHRGEVKLMGPTSATYLLHSTATVPPKAYDSFDLKYHHRWEVGRTGNGIIQIMEQNNESVPRAPIDIHLDQEIVQRLANSYFQNIAPILPIITQEEFLDSRQEGTQMPPPLLLYSICVVAAAHRSVSSTHFDALRNAVANVIKTEDVLSNASMVNVKSLLILGMSGDTHSSHVPSALSALWVRVGTAIRMAQDLGLHRTESVPLNIDMRRRLWAICVISDRWCSLTYGHPFMIDVTDCDTRLPSAGDANDAYLDELVRLSILLGKVLKMIYSPTGLTRATDEGLFELLNQIDTWKAALPHSLQHTGPTSSLHAGLLHLLYSCVCMLFWRVFMRISYTCPAHLKFGLSVERWSGLVDMTRESIEWLDANEEVYDVWLIVAYAATSCALVQYHTWARRRDKVAAQTLKRLRDCVQRWEKSISPEHMSTRRKTAEIITLLYEATQSNELPTDHDTPSLNPTAGVTTKVPNSLRGVVFRKDNSRPGGGVFVADKQRMDKGDLPLNTVVIKEDAGGRAVEEELPPDVDSRHDSNHSQPSNVERGAPYIHNDNAPSTTDGVPLLFSSRIYNENIVMNNGVDFHPPQINPGGPTNLNPSMNTVPTNPGVLLMNAVPEHQQYPQGVDENVLTSLANADQVLQGLPGSMFDWDQWETYFSRLGALPDTALNAFPASDGHLQAPQAEASGLNRVSSNPTAGQQYPFSATRGGGGDR